MGYCVNQFIVITYLCTYQNQFIVITYLLTYQQKPVH